MGLVFFGDATQAFEGNNSAGKGAHDEQTSGYQLGLDRGPILPVWMQIGVEVVGGVSVIDPHPLALGDGFEAPAHNPVDTETAGGGHSNR